LAERQALQEADQRIETELQRAELESDCRIGSQCARDPDRFYDMCLLRHEDQQRWR
jgi:hypothetical protein